MTKPEFKDLKKMIKKINKLDLVDEIDLSDVDEDDYEDMSAATIKATEDIEGKVNILVDINHCGKVPAKVRRMAKRDFEKETTGKVAMFGMHPVARILASFIIGITRKEDIRFFKTEAEALAWLKE